MHWIPHKPRLCSEICTCASRALKDVAISAVCQLEQMPRLIDWEGLIVSVIKVVTNRRGTHLGWIRSPGNNLFGVKWTCWELKHKDAAFRDFQLRGKGETGEPQVMSVVSIQLLWPAQYFVHAFRTWNRWLFYSSLKKNFTLDIKVCFCALKIKQALECSNSP